MEEEKKPTIQWIFDEYKRVIDGNTASGAIALGILKQYVPQTEEIVKRQDALLQQIADNNRRGVLLLTVLVRMVKALDSKNLALMSDLGEYADCEICKWLHYEPDETCPNDCPECTKDCHCAGCKASSNWEWRGIQD